MLQTVVTLIPFYRLLLHISSAAKYYAQVHIPANNVARVAAHLIVNRLRLVYTY